MCTTHDCDTIEHVSTSPAASGSPGTDATGGLAGLIDAVNSLDPDGSDRALIDQISQLEKLKSVCAAAQARFTHSFTLSQQVDGAARKVDADTTRRSIAAQIALARRDSRHRGQQHVGTAHALVTDMPETLSALCNGTLTEYRARTIIEQFACLTPADRSRGDATIAAELPGLGDRTAQTRAAAIAYRLDPEAVMGKIRGATTDRHVSLRPAPDTMSRLSALLPVAQGVAIYAALRAAADIALATTGDRTRSQLMADELVARATGHTMAGCTPYGAPLYGPAQQTSGDARNQGRDSARPDGDDAATEDSSDAGEAQCSGDGDTDRAEDDIEGGTDGAAPARADVAGADTPASVVEDPTHPAAGGTPEPVNVTARGTGPAHVGKRRGGLQINLIMTDRTLFGDDEPAHLTGYGPIPAALARALVIGHADTTTSTWIRRLYTDPTGTQLAAMDSRQRLFPAAAQRFLIARDQTCRTPWCDAPIRHLDHVIPHSRGGPTNTTNGQGLCAACNLSKQASGWRSRVNRDGSIDTTTPTGHTYPSNPPPLPTSPPWPVISHIEEHLARWQLDVA